MDEINTYLIIYLQGLLDGGTLSALESGKIARLIAYININIKNE